VSSPTEKDYTMYCNKDSDRIIKRKKDNDRM